LDPLSSGLHAPICEANVECNLRLRASNYIRRPGLSHTSRQILATPAAARFTRLLGTPAPPPCSLSHQYCPTPHAHSPLSLYHHTLPHASTACAGSRLSLGPNPHTRRAPPATRRSLTWRLKLKGYAPQFSLPEGGTTLDLTSTDIAWRPGDHPALPGATSGSPGILGCPQPTLGDNSRGSQFRHPSASAASGIPRHQLHSPSVQCISRPQAPKPEIGRPALSNTAPAPSTLRVLARAAEHQFQSSQLLPSAPSSYPSPLTKLGDLSSLRDNPPTTGAPLRQHPIGNNTPLCLAGAQDPRSGSVVSLVTPSGQN